VRKECAGNPGAVGRRSTSPYPAADISIAKLFRLGCAAASDCPTPPPHPRHRRQAGERQTSRSNGVRLPAYLGRGTRPARRGPTASEPEPPPPAEVPLHDRDRQPDHRPHRTRKRARVRHDGRREVRLRHRPGAAEERPRGAFEARVALPASPRNRSSRVTSQYASVPLAPAEDPLPLEPPNRGTLRVEDGRGDRRDPERKRARRTSAARCAASTATPPAQIRLRTTSARCPRTLRLRGRRARFHTRGRPPRTLRKLATPGSPPHQRPTAAPPWRRRPRP